MATRKKTVKRKPTTLLQILVGIQQGLEILDQFVDVDRLIGISNAQGPQAKLVKDVLRPEHFEDMADELKIHPPDTQPKAATSAKRKALSQ